MSGHYEDLISQAAGVERLEAHLEMMTAHMDTLSAASERLRARVVEPYKVIRYAWSKISSGNVVTPLPSRSTPNPFNNEIAGLKQ